ncbi:MAG: BlaI/MecI/CopY family transcriptional regulator, partial [Candidatus Geothermarchaeales archaeon]
MQLQLGPLEARVLAVMAEMDELSVRDVLVRLGEQREFAYTTIATTLDRLYSKGLVRRRKV